LPCIPSKPSPDSFPPIIFSVFRDETEYVALIPPNRAPHFPCRFPFFSPFLARLELWHNRVHLYCNEKTLHRCFVDMYRLSGPECYVLLPLSFMLVFFPPLLSQKVQFPSPLPVPDDRFPRFFSFQPILPSEPTFFC